MQIREGAKGLDFYRYKRIDKNTYKEFDTNSEAFKNSKLSHKEYKEKNVYSSYEKTKIFNGADIIGIAPKVPKPKKEFEDYTQIKSSITRAIKINESENDIANKMFSSLKKEEYYLKNDEKDSTREEVKNWAKDKSIDEIKKTISEVNNLDKTFVQDSYGLIAKFNRVDIFKEMEASLDKFYNRKDINAYISKDFFDKVKENVINELKAEKEKEVAKKIESFAKEDLKTKEDKLKEEDEKTSEKSESPKKNSIKVAEAEKVSLGKSLKNKAKNINTPSVDGAKIEVKPGEMEQAEKTSRVKEVKTMEKGKEVAR